MLGLNPAEIVAGLDTTAVGRTDNTVRSSNSSRYSFRRERLGGRFRGAGMVSERTNFSQQRQLLRIMVSNPAGGEYKARQTESRIRGEYFSSARNACGG